MKLAVVVQRYGADISGGAELHARYIAERLARHATVEVLTTCARDYITWKNELPPGEEHGQRRDRPAVSGRAAAQHRRVRPAVATSSSSSRTRSPTSCSWLDSEGPDEPGAHPAHRARAATTFDFFVFFSYRYYHAWHGARAVAGQGGPRADGRTRSGDRPGDLRAACSAASRALMYNSFEERALIQRVSRPQGSRASSSASARRFPERTQPWRFRKKFNVKRPFAIYIGRIDENKGCARAVRLLRALRGDVSARARPACWSDRRVLDDPEASAHPAPRLPVGRGQVRRARGRRRADHAVAVREPVDGRARGVGARQAGAGQRPLRRPARPGRAQQRRAVLRERSRSSPRRCTRSKPRARSARCSAATAASSSAATTRGR